MSKNTRVYTREAVNSKLVETLGGDSVPYQLEEGGETFHLPHPFFHDRATKKALEALKPSDEEGRARVLLGDEQFDRFIEAGGEPDEISRLNVNIQLDAQEILSGQGPTKR